MSVNLSWYIQSGPITAIHNSCQVTQTSGGSYFCICAFNGGYMGIQDVPTAWGNVKRIIFSLWDQGSAPTAIYSGAGVSVERFGGEGTGLKTIDDGVGWAVGELVVCMVLCKPQGGYSNYAGYYYRNGTWKHMASVSVPNAAAFTSHYVFVEDFQRNGGNQTRSAVFGPVWAMASDNWEPAAGCKFGASYDKNENGEAVNTEAAGPARRSLETGGEVRGKWKLESVYDLAPGMYGPPTDLPQFPFWF